MLKRLFDIICSSIGIILLSPILILIAIVIKLDSKGSIFYRQIRVGRYEKTFAIHKFRTMIMNADKQGLKITIGADKRITTIGRVLRKTKLDELPQLFDVLLGRMSIVGPRPEVPEYVTYYPKEVKKIIFSVRPGITDYASLKMIDENEILAKSNNPAEAYINIILPEKLGYAVKYVKTQNIFIDIYLIILTIAKIFTR